MSVPDGIDVLSVEDRKALSRAFANLGEAAVELGRWRIGDPSAFERCLAASGRAVQAASQLNPTVLQRLAVSVLNG